MPRRRKAAPVPSTPDGQPLPLKKHHRTLVITFIIITLILLVAFGTQGYLFVRFLLGYDTIVSLSADKTHVPLAHSEDAAVTFTTSVTVNPFCTAVCTSTLLDLGHNRTLARTVSQLRPGLYSTKTYMLTVPTLGTGLDLYRYDVQCHGVSTFLCHTDETLQSTRSVIVTAAYNLSDAERVLRTASRSLLLSLAANASDLHARHDAITQTLQDAASVGLIHPHSSALAENAGQLAAVLDTIPAVEALWADENDTAFAAAILDFDSAISDLAARIETITAYNSLIASVTDALSTLDQQTTASVTNDTLDAQLLTAFGDLGARVLAFQTNGTLDEKTSLAVDISTLSTSIASNFTQAVREETLLYEITLDIVQDALCKASGACSVHTDPATRVNETRFDLNNTCADIDAFHDVTSTVNTTIHQSNASWLDDAAIRSSARDEASDLLSNIAATNFQALPTGPNTEIINAIISTLTTRPNGATANNTDALTLAVIERQPPRCVPPDAPRPRIPTLAATPLAFHEPVSSPIALTLDEPSPRCCVFDECTPCCTTPECLADPDTLPVILLHGHAFNQDVSAEYSIDGFHTIEQRLEDEGIIKAGAITLYTERDVPDGLYGLVPAPLLFRASYYFDIFRQPDDYVLVQTKSENIDTYAIRLKELIDTVEQRTGKSRVNILAYSMGGLVARRYLQIFGDDHVEKLITLGTPHQGITPDVARDCGLIGAQLECRDMTEGSLFLNKLNTGRQSNVPITAIIGTGCPMEGGNGDGVVVERNARLESAQAVLVNGTCRSTTVPLHLDLLDVTRYPAVIDAIRDALAVTTDK